MKPLQQGKEFMKKCSLVEQSLVLRWGLRHVSVGPRRRRTALSRARVVVQEWHGGWEAGHAAL